MKKYKLKTSFLLLLTLFISCEINEQSISKIEPFEVRAKKAIVEIGIIYEEIRATQGSYEESVRKVNLVSDKYNIRIEPMTNEDFDLFFVVAPTGGEDGPPCEGDFTTELVYEGDGCYGQVWHYENGATGFQRSCWDDNTKFGIRVYGWHCNGPAYD